jgi:hypothetical protein
MFHSNYSRTGARLLKHSLRVLDIVETQRDDLTGAPQRQGGHETYLLVTRVCRLVLAKLQHTTLLAHKLQLLQSTRKPHTLQQTTSHPRLLRDPW